MKKYYSVKEAASLLGVSTNTIYTYLKEGKISSRRIGKGRFKIPYTSLAPFINTSNFDVVQEVNNSSQDGYQIVNGKDINENIAGFGGGNKDLIFYRLFKALLLLGVGIIYLVIDPIKINSAGLFGDASDVVLVKILPIALIITGLTSLVNVFYPDKFKSIKGWVHSFTALVLVYYSLCAICVQNYSSLVFSTSLLIVTLLHIFKGVAKPDSSNLLNQFSKYVTSLVILSGIVIVLKPESIPFENVSEILSSNKGTFILLWYVIFIPLLTLLLRSKRKPVLFDTLFFSLGSVLVFIFATQLTMSMVWDTGYMTFLTGIFSLFMAVWSILGEKIEKRRLYISIIGLSWISLSCLFGLFALHLSQENIKEETTSLVNSDLGKSSVEINNFFEDSKALITSYVANPSVKEALVNQDTQSLTKYAQEIFGKVYASQRVIFYDNSGVSYGIYPHFNMGLGTDYSEREYFQRTKSAHKGYVSNYFESILGEKTIIQTEPIFSGNQFMGMIGLGYSLEGLTDQFQSNLGDGFAITAVDENGIIIFSSNRGTIGSKFDDEEKDGLFGTDEYVTASQVIKYPNWKVYYYASLTPQIYEKSGLNVAIALIVLVNSIFTIGFSLMLSLKEGIRVTGIPQNLSLNKVSHTA